MLRRTITVLALAASLVALGIPPSLAGSKGSSGSYSGWYDTNGTASQSRANLLEKVLTPSAVKKVVHLRDIVAPVTKPGAACRTQDVVAPVPTGNYLYAITSGKVSKYNPATGKLIWRQVPPTNSTYLWLAVSGNIVIASGLGCGSASEPPGILAAYNATTGQFLWGGGIEGQSGAVAAGPYVVEAGADAAGYEVAVRNLSNGGLVWSNFGCQTYDPEGPLVVGQMVISYGCDNQDDTTIQANGLATGKLAWSLPVGWQFQRGDLSGSTGAHLYATDPSGTVEDLDPQTGQEEYSLSGATTVLAVDLSRVYATCGQFEYICAYNIGDGALEWQNMGGITVGTSLAAEADGVLYTSSGAALNTATGKIIRSVWSSNNAAASAIAVGNGRIAAVTDPRVLDLYGLKGE